MKHIFGYCVICLLAVSFLSACSHHSHSGPDRDGTMELILRMPSASLPDYKSASRTDGGVREKGNGLPMRAVVEVYESGGGQRVTRNTFNPAKNPDGNSYTVRLVLPKGIYDVYMWTDYADPLRPAADNFYNTSDLRSVAVMASPYRSPYGGKDAACAVLSALEHGDSGTSKNIYLQRPFAKYRVIATDLQRYNDLRQSHPESFPDVAELTFEINYEYFFPTSYNLLSARPNDSASGVSFTSRAEAAGDYPKEEALVIASDVVFADNSDAFLTLTLVVRDGNGNEIKRSPGIRVDYRRGFLTTVSGNFLTAGHGSGGVEINTDWDEDIIIRF